MPSKSTKQRNYIFYLRGKYKSKKNTPEKQKWIWDQEWTQIEESSFLSEIKAWIDPDGNYLPFIRIKNHDDMLPLGLRYGDALRKGWIRLYKTPERIHITCHTFDAKELKCCMKIFNQVDELKTLPIVIATGSKIIKYNPLFKEKEESAMKRYVRKFKETSGVTWEEFKDLNPDQVWNIKGAFKAFLKRSPTENELKIFYKKNDDFFWDTKGGHQVVQPRPSQVTDLVRVYLKKDSIKNRDGNLGGSFQD